MHPRLADRDFAQSGDEATLGQVAVADDLPSAALVGQMRVPLDPLGDLGFDGLGQQHLGSPAQDVAQTVSRCWQWNRRCGNFGHGGVLLEKKAVG